MRRPESAARSAWALYAGRVGRDRSLRPAAAGRAGEGGAVAAPVVSVGATFLAGRGSRLALLPGSVLTAARRALGRVPGSRARAGRVGRHSRRGARGAGGRAASPLRRAGNGAVVGRH